MKTHKSDEADDDFIYLQWSNDEHTAAYLSHGKRGSNGEPTSLVREMSPHFRESSCFSFLFFFFWEHAPQISPTVVNICLLSTTKRRAGRWTDTSSWWSTQPRKRRRRSIVGDVRGHCCLSLLCPLRGRGSHQRGRRRPKAGESNVLKWESNTSGTPPSIKWFMLPFYVNSFALFFSSHDHSHILDDLRGQSWHHNPLSSLSSRDLLERLPPYPFIITPNYSKLPLPSKWLPDWTLLRRRPSFLYAAWL